MKRRPGGVRPRRGGMVRPRPACAALPRRYAVGVPIRTWGNRYRTVPLARMWNENSKKETDSSSYRGRVCLTYSHSSISRVAETAMTARRHDKPMLSLHRIGRVREGFAVAIALLSLLLASDTADASCGSHATLRSPSENVVQAVRPLTDFGLLPSDDEFGKPRPCSGPTCSNRPWIPDSPVAPAVPSVHPPKDGASSASTYILVAEPVSARLAESLSPPHPFQRPSSIFRPPRLPRHSR